MKRLLPLLLLSASVNAFAARPTAGHQPFPEDYRPHPCAPESACASLTPSVITRAGSTLRGYSIRQEWVDAHWNDMMELIGPTCAKLATCYATPNNSSLFCMDLLFPEFWEKCDRYPDGSDDFDQCAMFVRIFTLRADLQDKPIWTAAQECTAKLPAPAGPKPMKVWIAPETIGDDYKGRFTVYALDPETKVPIQALVTMSGRKLTARAPGGLPWTNYEIEWPAALQRVPNAAGHTDLVAPTVTVTADGFTPVTFAMPAAPRKAIVSMTPPAAKLKRGKNKITVTATDALTGKPIELRVMAGQKILGDSNKPLALEWKSGQKRPEIWTTSLFNQYSDIVVAPAGK